jgi:hypothetical protein
MSVPVWRSAVHSQYLAALDMLENAILACPDRVWDDASVSVAHRFWYLAYHTLFWLDHYLAERAEGFAPPPPYTLGEMDPAGVYPDRAYAKAELLGYLAHGREKLHRTFAELSEARAEARCDFPRRDLSVLELHLYDMRHVQHHTAQLNLLLRQHAVEPPRWVGRGKLPAGSE